MKICTRSIRNFGCFAACDRIFTIESGPLFVGVAWKPIARTNNKKPQEQQIVWPFKAARNESCASFEGYQGQRLACLKNFHANRVILKESRRAKDEKHIHRMGDLFV